MFELSDAFMSLPGGLGTLDETIEIITWRQLKLHDKPILICDVAGSADPLLASDRGRHRRRVRAAGFARFVRRTSGVTATVLRLQNLHAANGGRRRL